jgi:hypothetical protein
VREQVGKYLVESYIVDIMKKIQEAIWPNGIRKQTLIIRSPKEKTRTKREAGYKLTTIFEGTHVKTLLIKTLPEVSWAMRTLDLELPA